MGIEEQIRTLIEQGNTPQSLIEIGYRKSTVYKVYATTRTFSGVVRNSDWIIENVRHDKDRYQPGEISVLSFDLVNLSHKDLYLLNVGIQAEWMIAVREEWYWYSQTVGDILKPMQRRNFSISIPIPVDIALGEYEVRFGLIGQYLPATNSYDQYMAPRWSVPYILHIKHPLKAEKIFLSHSIKDRHLVINLQKNFDYFGYEVIIGEDQSEPGSLLQEKFSRLIDSCSVFIALITEFAIRSKWVKLEIEYARSIGKPWILLKEISVPNLASDYEWTEFDRNWSQDQIFDVVSQSLTKVKLNQSMLNPSLVTIIGLSLISFLIGWYLRK